MSAPERPVHWTWLMGPEDRPDPHVGERSLSAAARSPLADLSLDAQIAARARNVHLADTPNGAR